jgi:hypothetical protein
MEATATCAACGRPLEDRRRRYCSTVCKDRARRERAEATAVQASAIASSAPEGVSLSAPGSDAPESAHGKRGGLLALAAIPFLVASGAVYYLRRRR